jgi:hypothetical protein
VFLPRERTAAPSARIHALLAQARWTDVGGDAVLDDEWLARPLHRRRNPGPRPMST